MLIKDLMTKDVITVSMETPLREVGRILKENRISGVPVIDDTGSVIGIITINDILRIIQEIYQWQKIEREATGVKLSDLVGKEHLNVKAKNVMTKNVVTLDEENTIYDLMQVMFTKKIHTIPIVKQDRLVGIVGKRDLVYSCF